jgi:tetratricopeptide (TPR) repeat protein
VDLAIVFALAKDEYQTRAQLEACLRMATLPGLRTLRPDALFNFLSLLQRAKLGDERPALFATASTLLPPGLRVELLIQLADVAKAELRFKDEVPLLHQALAINPDSIFALNRLAWLRATATDDSLRNSAEAVTLALHSRELDGGQHVNVSDTLACAYAEAGDFAQAIHIEEDAIALAEKAAAADPQVEAIASQMRAHLALFQQNKPWRE